MKHKLKVSEHIFEMLALMGMLLVSFCLSNHPLNFRTKVKRRRFRHKEVTQHATLVRSSDSVK